MELEGWLFVTVAVLFGAGAAILANQKRQKTSRDFSSLAKQFHGRVERIRWFAPPELSIEHGGNQVVFTVHAASEEPDYAKIRAPFPDRTFRCNLRRGEVHAFIQFLGIQDIEIGSPEFDKRYVIQGAPVEEVREFLRPDVQGLFLALDRRVNRSTVLRICGGVLEVDQDAAGASYEAMQEFLGDFLPFYDAVLNRTPGISLLDAAPAAVRVGKSTACLVCGEGMEGEIVLCRRCRTPHHRDCWDYNGSCSTYGCGEKSCYPVRRKPAGK